jgi:CBS domain-containing protein
MLTDRDVRSALGYDKESRLDLRVEEVMTSGVICAKPAMDLREAVDILREHRFRALPVVKENQLVGILSTTDLLSKLRADLDEPPPAPHTDVGWGPW